MLLEDREEPLDPVIRPSNTKSDEFEALHLIEEETRLRKNREKEVLQYRAWKVAEAFRSEADYIQGGTCVLAEVLEDLMQFHP